MSSSETARTRAVPAPLVAVATVDLILVGALLLLLQPPYMHAALDASGSAAILGLDRARTHVLSDQTVRELLFGPATFAFNGPTAGPFYDPAEAAHLRDARHLLLVFLATGVVSAATLAVAFVRDRDRSSFWSGVRRGGASLAIAVVLLGIFGVVAFDRAFELFHRVFFPGGNWAFDPSRQRLVQLYPIGFWQLTSAALGALAALGGVGAWALGRRRSAQRRLQRDSRGATA